MSWNITTIEITPEANSPQFTATITFAKQGEENVTFSTRLSSRNELENTIRSLIERLNERSALIAETSGGTFTLTPPPEPAPETAKAKAEREYREALALFEDLKAKAELDPTTFNWGRDNQRVIVQQKLQALIAVS